MKRRVKKDICCEGCQMNRSEEKRRPGGKINAKKHMGCVGLREPEITDMAKWKRTFHPCIPMIKLKGRRTGRRQRIVNCCLQCKKQTFTKCMY